MTGDSRLHASFVVLTPDGPSGLSTLFRAVLADPWVASYQVGFGAPILRSTPELTRAASRAPSVLAKLQIYLEACLLDEEARQGYVAQLRRRLSAGGPVEAEALNVASEEVFDLSLRLHAPSTAPAGMVQRMRAHGVTSETVPARTPPEALTGRFRLHLHDPRGVRLLSVPAVASAVPDAEVSAAVELRVPSGSRVFFQRWLVDLETRAPQLAVVDLGEPTSHARVHRDGHLN